MVARRFLLSQLITPWWLPSKQRTSMMDVMQKMQLDVSRFSDIKSDPNSQVLQSASARINDFSSQRLVAQLKSILPRHGDQRVLLSC
jgi:hypothetical protein